MDSLEDLNRERMSLALEIKTLSKKYAETLSTVYNMVSVDEEDIAESYFTPSHDNYFSQRMDACLKHMKAEVRHLEEILGAQMHDLEEELDHELHILFEKEKQLTNWRRKVLDVKIENSMNEAKVLDESQSGTTEVQELLELRDQSQRRLSLIESRREEQLQRDVVELSQRGPSARRQRILTATAVAANRAIEASIANSSHKQIEDRECLLRESFFNLLTVHQSTLARYQTLRGSLTVSNAISPSFAANRRRSVRMSIINRPQLSVVTDMSWRTDIMNQYNQALNMQLECDHDRQRNHEDALMALQSQAPSAEHKSQSEEMQRKHLREELSIRLAAIYLRHNENILNEPVTITTTSPSPDLWPNNSTPMPHSGTVFTFSNLNSPMGVAASGPPSLANRQSSTFSFRNSEGQGDSSSRSSSRIPFF